MRKIFFVLSLVISGFCGFGQGGENLRMYVGTFTSEGAEGIYLCDFNQETGSLSLDKTFIAVDNPSFLKISPNNEYLYVVSRSPNEIEKSGGFVSAYKIMGNGSLKFLNKQISNGADPCHVDVSPDGKYVAIANYSGGTTALYPLKENGSLYPASSVIFNSGSSVNQARQSKPHAHSIKFSPFDNQVFSADLGTDKLNIYNLENGKLQNSSQEFLKLEAGAGPRHLDFHPGRELIYVINELISTITVFRQKAGVWENQQTISTLPEDFIGTSYCADIHVSSDGNFIYGSNRGHNSIAVFSTNGESKKLKVVDFVSVEGDWPRNFVLSPNGRFMIVANQRSGNINVFKINPETGIPIFTGNEIKLPSPVCLEFLNR